MAKKLSTTSKGVAIWPRLGSPDYKYDPAGVYTTKLGLIESEAAPIVAALEVAMNEALAEAKAKYAVANKEQKKGGKPLKVPAMTDPPFYVDEETGLTVFSFKMKASGKSKKDNKKFTQKPMIFDATGTPVEGLQIGGGSIIRVSYEIVPFNSPVAGAGASLRLRGVQVLKLMPYGSGNAAYFGFDKEEGFTTDAPAKTEAEESVFEDFENETTSAGAAAAGSESDDF